MNKNILHAIFFDKEHHWDSLVRIHKKRIRSVVLSEVDKFHYCGDVRKGFRLFVCEGCHDVKHVPIRCKGKFCPTCAVGESQRWSDMIADDMYHTIHRHIVFTIDEGLRDLFLLHREELLKGLMDEAANVVKALLQYISRYMKRGPIALERIIYYDGDTVLFRYHDKRTNKEAIKIMGAKEFILSLIRHIPDKGFKTIRHYGLYSRCIKKTVQKVVRHLQEKMTKLLIRARKDNRNIRNRSTQMFEMRQLLRVQGDCCVQKRTAYHPICERLGCEKVFTGGD